MNIKKYGNIRSSLLEISTFFAVDIRFPQQESVRERGLLELFPKKLEGVYLTDNISMKFDFGKN